MKAIMGYSYSELDKHYEYYVIAERKWTWFGMGEMVSKEMVKHIYPFRTGKPIEEWEYNSNDARSLGHKCAKRLNQLYETYGFHHG